MITGKLMVLTALVLMTALMPMAALADDKSEVAPAAEKKIVAAVPKAWFENLKDGDTVTSPFKVKFGVSGMEVKPAGDATPNSGHFHLLIDTALTDEQMKNAIPKDDQHKHFGKGETETDVTLPAGKHTLQIVMADGNHVPHNPPVMSDKITVTVK
jgi:hypothetical protein